MQQTPSLRAALKAYTESLAHKDKKIGVATAVSASVQGTQSLLTVDTTIHKEQVSKASQEAAIESAKAELAKQADELVRQAQILQDQIGQMRKKPQDRSTSHRTALMQTAMRLSKHQESTLNKKNRAESIILPHLVENQKVFSRMRSDQSVLAGRNFNITERAMIEDDP